MYSIAQFGDMLADKVRVSAYAQAMRRCVNQDSVVLDIGTGTGIFALLACQLGARRVFAIEPSDAIHVARELAAANGCEGRIEFIQALSTRVTLAERASVIVSDLRGVLPLHGIHIEAIADARARHLAPGGVLIPRSDSLWAALVQSERHYRRVLEPWKSGVEGVAMQPVSTLLANQWWRAEVAKGELMSGAERVATLDYTVVSTGDLDAEITLAASAPGTSHGFCLWFDADLADGIAYSNAPGAGDLVYGRAFFPWLHPVPLETGGEVRLRLQARRAGGEYLWNWQSSFRDAAGVEQAGFRQSTFLGQPLVPARLAKQSPAHVPQLNEDGAVDARVLALMAQELSVGEIAERLASEFPARFIRAGDALAHAAALSLKYGR